MGASLRDTFVVMRGNLRPFGVTSRTKRHPRWDVRVPILAASLSAVSLLPTLSAQSGVERDSVEVITYLQTQLPPSEGSPVCPTGGVDPIGRVSRVKLLPGHLEYHNAWEIVMEINKRDAAGITTDSVVSARVDRSCGGSVEPFLDINVIGAGPPIAYRTALKGEVTYFAEIAYLLPPKSWWQRAIDRTVDFAEMEIGVIYVQLFGAVMIVVAGFTALTIVICRRQKTREAKPAIRPLISNSP
jgi:hypothetical protein